MISVLCKYQRHQAHCCEKVVLVCSNYAWTIYNFRLSLLRRLKKDGYKVIVLTQFDGYEKFFENEVYLIKPLIISRSGMNPVLEILTFFNIFWIALYYRVNVLLLFTIKPVIYGSLVGRLLRRDAIPMITGLGTTFIKKTRATLVIHNMYRLALRNCKTVFFQNEDDKNLFFKHSLVSEAVVKITPGSGVNLDKYCYVPAIRQEHVCFLLVARMIWDKGISEFVQAARRVKMIYPNARFQLLGPKNVQNPTAIPSKQIADWISSGEVEYLGATDDVIPYIKAAHCIVLPSYREGTPKSLLEACAVGRPIITTDVPGCREVLQHGINGFLCIPKDVSSLVTQMGNFLELDWETRGKMGRASRALAESKFSEEIVCDMYIEALEIRSG